MPTASSTLSVPSKLGTRPAANALGSTPTCSRSYMKPSEDDAEEARDRQLEAAVAARLQLEDREGHDRGHQAGRERRDAEEQVQRDRRADELRQVGRDRDRLGLQPEPERDRLLEVLAAQLRAGSCPWRCRSWPTGTARASPSGWRRRSPTAACSRTWRRPRCWWRSCRGRCRRPRRRRPGRAARSARGSARASASASQRARAGGSGLAASRRAAASVSVGGFKRGRASRWPAGRRARASPRRPRRTAGRRTAACPPPARACPGTISRAAR